MPKPLLSNISVHCSCARRQTPMPTFGAVKVISRQTPMLTFDDTKGFEEHQSRRQTPMPTIREEPEPTPKPTFDPDELSYYFMDVSRRMEKAGVRSLFRFPPNPWEVQVGDDSIWRVCMGFWGSASKPPKASADAEAPPTPKPPKASEAPPTPKPRTQNRSQARRNRYWHLNRRQYQLSLNEMD